MDFLILSKWCGLKKKTNHYYFLFSPKYSVLSDSGNIYKRAEYFAIIKKNLRDDPLIGVSKAKSCNFHFHKNDVT